MTDHKTPRGDEAPPADPVTVGRAAVDHQTEGTGNSLGGDTARFEWGASAPDSERTKLHGAPLPSGSGSWSPGAGSGTGSPASPGTLRLASREGELPGADAADADSARPRPARSVRTERTVIVPEENVGWDDETDQGLATSRLRANPPVISAEREVDPWAFDETVLDAGSGSSLDPIDGHAPGDEGSTANVEHTVMLDPEMQDRLMALRAQQDQVLKARFTGDVVVMFTDLVGSTSYYERHGDLMGREKMLTHNALLFPIIRTRNGTVIKTIGDAIMCCFDDVDAALSAAEEMQQALQAFNHSCEDADEEIHIRIGMNSGPAIAEDGDLHGDAINVAARVEAKAQGDQVLVSESVKAAAGRETFEPIGRIAFKGKAERVGVYLFCWGSAVPHRAQTGPRLVGDRYRLGETIGRGPDGVVYGAEDTQLRQPVAIKLLHDHVVEDAERAKALGERFLGLASLRHEGIVRLLDFSSVDADEPYYVMDRIEGLDLSAWVSQHSAASPVRAARLVLDAARAVAHAHAHGVLHGNIKPENMFIKPDGRLMLGDFGIAAADRAESTRSGTSVASPAFQAPEQVTGLVLTERTDVYGLGAVLYYLLAGQPPYDIVASLRNMRAVASGTCRRLGAIRSGLPQKIIDITERAMSSRPEARYATVAELGAALAAFCSAPAADSQQPTVQLPDLADIPSGPRGSEPTLRALPPARELVALRRALVAVSLVAGVAVVTAGVSVVFLLRTKGGPAAPSPSAGVSAPATRLRNERRTQRGKAQVPAATGRLQLMTGSWGADVYIDDDKVGRTPQLRTIDLPAGTYRLRLVNPKRQPYLEQIQILAGKTIRKKINLRAPK